MIVRLDKRLFDEEYADDALLLEILNHGKDGRYGVLVEPAFKLPPEPHIEAWLDRQSQSSARTAIAGLRRGTEWTRYRWPEGRTEPEVIIEPRDKPEWPASFDDGPARLPLDHTAQVFLNTSLRILVENGRADWRFLGKIVPKMWSARWRKAVDREWIAERNGGGITEMRQKIVQDVATTPKERLRTWALFDSDAETQGQPSRAANDTMQACQDHHVPFHMLQRRMIENYIPEAVMTAWVGQLCQEVRRNSTRQRYRDEAHAASQRVDAYWNLDPEDRHHHDLKGVCKAGGRERRELGFGEPADIWRDDVWQITQADITADGWRAEQDAIFLSLFASL